MTPFVLPWSNVMYSKIRCGILLILRIRLKYRKDAWKLCWSILFDKLCFASGKFICKATSSSLWPSLIIDSEVKPFFNTKNEKISLSEFETTSPRYVLSLIITEIGLFPISSEFKKIWELKSNWEFFFLSSMKKYEFTLPRFFGQSPQQLVFVATLLWMTH